MIGSQMGAFTRRASWSGRVYGSMLERTFAFLLHAEGLPEPVREYRFDPGRRWRFDFAWPAARVAVELEGGIWAGGRHTRGPGFAADCEKYNAAALAGWCVLRFTGEMVEDGTALTLVAKVIQNGGRHDIP